MATVTAVTKHFPVPKEGFTTTAASTIGSGAATVPLNSVTGYTNGDTVVMVIEPASATNKQAFTGVIDTAGVQVTGVVWTEGTNTSHAAGSTVVDYVAATHMAMVTKGLLRDHNQSGYHKTLNDDNGNEWIKQAVVASAVNEITVSNNATTLPPKITATGNDTNIDVQIAGKGTGKAHVDGFMEVAFDFIVSGGVLSGLGYGSTLTAAMTAIILYINGQRGSIAAVATRTYTASKDTYVDVLNTAGVFTLVYTEVANNAASPALAANSIRLGIIVSGATFITDVGSVNQGQEKKILPISGGFAYTTTDSLGNLICPRDPSRSILGYRETPTTFSNASATAAVIPGLRCPVIVPTGRAVKVTSQVRNLYNGAVANGAAILSVWDGTAGSGTQLTESFQQGATSDASPPHCAIKITPTATSKTYDAGLARSSAGTASFDAGPTQLAYIMIELV